MIAALASDIAAAGCAASLGAADALRIGAPVAAGVAVAGLTVYAAIYCAGRALIGLFSTAQRAGASLAPKSGAVEP